MSAKLRAAAQNTALLLSVLVLLFVFCEIAANILVKIGIGQLNQIAGERASNIVMTSPDPELGYVYRPNVREPEWNFVTNSAGFREREWSAPDLTGSNVVVNLGDSITFGMNVNKLDDVYGKVVESHLNRAGGEGNKRYIVYNAGIGGYNVWQQHALLNHLSGRIRYNMVILGLCLNDSSPKLYVSEEAKGAVVSVPGKIESVRDIFSRKFLGRSKAYVMFKESIKSLQRRYPQAFPSSTLWHNVLVREHDWDRLKQTLREMRDALHEKNVPFVVAIFPYQHQLQLTKEDNLAQKDLMAFCRSNAIHCLDLYDSFAPNRHLIQWDIDGVHPDRNGHRVAGKAIYEYLVSNHLVPIAETGPARTYQSPVASTDSRARGDSQLQP